MLVLERWFRLVFAAAVMISSAVGRADDAVTPERVRQAIDRGLNFLQVDAVKWRADHQCATCHHGTLTVLALAEAKRSDIPVDAEKFTDVVNWTKERLSKIDEPRDTRPGWSMVNTPAIYLGLLTQFVAGQDVISADELKRIHGHLIRHQEENGSWAWSSAPPANRPPPFFESDEVATLLALLTYPVEPELASDELQASRKKAIDWLTRADETDTTQAAALRLLWRKRLDANEGLRPDIERFLKRQRPDGGFAQLADRPSDAYATGQSLYILSLLGEPSDRPELVRAIRFLVSSQREDGSWQILRRGHAGVTPSANVVPITYFGSAWGTLALIRATRKE